MSFPVDLRSDTQGGMIYLDCKACEMPCELELATVSERTLRVRLTCPGCGGKLVLHVTRPVRPELKVLSEPGVKARCH